MAQYKTGTVSVTNGSATVTGSGTLWSGEIAAGDLFTIVGDNAWYEVASVGSNTSITLSANYAGTTGSGKSYAISRDFTTRLALPYPQKGDIETASIIKRAFEQIDTETNIATANYSATSAPTANDDSGDGYSIGSWWVNVTSDEAYLCVDATVGAAVWTKISVDVPSEIVALLAGQSVSMASLTLSGGTANGVLYLNGSKVATSGSALTFDGTNLGIGTSSYLNAYTRLQLTRAGYVQQVFQNTLNSVNAEVAAYDSYVSYGSLTNHPIAFQINNSEAMRLDSSGNLGLGVTPSAWGSAYKSLEVNGAVIQASSSNKSQAGFGNNYYHNGTNYIYSTSNYATSYFQNSGAHTWYTAPSGTAGNAITFTQAMTLDASGRLLVGLTSGTSGYNIEAQAGASGTGIRASNSGGGYIAIEAESNASSNGVLRWTNDLKLIQGSTECARIDGSGNLIQSAPSTAPTLSTNRTMVFNLTSDTNLRVSVRGSDGVTRTANITLA